MSAGVRPVGNAARGWAAPMRAMRWATVARLLGACCAVWAIGVAATAAEGAWLATLHRSFGVAALTLTLARLLWRQRTGVPPLPADRVSVLGAVLLPFARPLARGTFQAHGRIALLLLDVIGVHVAAALFRHLVRRDEVPSAMLPRRWRPLPPSRPGASVAAKGILR